MADSFVRGLCGRDPLVRGLYMWQRLIGEGSIYVAETHW